MSQLDEIKVRVENAMLHETLDPSAYAELAWGVVADVPKLVAALEAVQEIVAKLRALQLEENVSKNACAGGVANVLEEVIEEALS